MTELEVESLLRGLSGGAAVAGALALVRLILEFVVRRSDRASDEHERRRRYQRDAESRIERLLQDRLAQADRRLDRYAADVELERAQRVAVEREYALLEQAHELLKEQYALLLRERGCQSDVA